MAHEAINAFAASPSLHRKKSFIRRPLESMKGITLFLNLCYVFFSAHIHCAYLWKKCHFAKVLQLPTLSHNTIGDLPASSSTIVSLNYHRICL